MLTNFKNKLLKSIKSRKLNLFGLFFLLAFVFLIISKLSKTYTETITFNISLQNIPEEHSLITIQDSVVNIVVKSYGFNLLPYVLFDQSIEINFNKDVTLRSKEYIWSSRKNIQTINKKFNEGVEVLSVNPDTLVFPFQSLAVKLVPIRSTVDIQYASGYDVIDNVKLKPDSVKVVGPKNLISKINFVKTKTVTFKNVNNSFEKLVELDFKPKNDNLYISEKNVTISGRVEKFTEGVVEVPVTIVNLPANTNINFFPKTVTVIYYVSLNRYNEIKSTDFKVECDYMEISNSNRTFLTPKLTKTSSKIKTARLKQDKIEFILLQ